MALDNCVSSIRKVRMVLKSFDEVNSAAARREKCVWEVVWDDIPTCGLAGISSQDRQSELCAEQGQSLLEFGEVLHCPSLLWHCLRPQLCVISNHWIVEAKVLLGMLFSFEVARCDIGELYGGEDRGYATKFLELR